jgi:hypothetical protein
MPGAHFFLLAGVYPTGRGSRSLSLRSSTPALRRRGRRQQVHLFFGDLAKRRAATSPTPGICWNCRTPGFISQYGYEHWDEYESYCRREWVLGLITEGGGGGEEWEAEKSEERETKKERKKKEGKGRLLGFNPMQGNLKRVSLMGQEWLRCLNTHVYWELLSKS